MKDRSTINNSEFDAFDETRASRAASKPAGRSVSEILQEIVNHVTEIIRSEFRLARVEVKEDVTQVSKAGVFLVAGAAFAFHAMGFVLLGLVYALGARMPLWVAAVAVGAGAAIVAGVFLKVGLGRIKQGNLTPDKTIRSLQENVRWMKKQTK